MNFLLSWDDGEITRLPEYMRPLYKALLELYKQFEEELANEGRSYAPSYSKEAVRYIRVSIFYNHTFKTSQTSSFLFSFFGCLKCSIVTAKGTGEVLPCGGKVVHRGILATIQGILRQCSHYQHLLLSHCKFFPRNRICPKRRLRMAKQEA